MAAGEDQGRASTGSHHVMARVAHFQELERRYLPGAEERRPTGLAWSTRW